MLRAWLLALDTAFDAASGNEELAFGMVRLGVSDRSLVNMFHEHPNVRVSQGCIDLNYSYYVLCKMQKSQTDLPLKANVAACERACTANTISQTLSSIPSTNRISDVHG